MQRDKLAYMANQIATFFQSSPEGARSDGVADHINMFWEPRMRTQLFERIDAGKTDDLHPLVDLGPGQALDDAQYPPARKAARRARQPPGLIRHL